MSHNALTAASVSILKCVYSALFLGELSALRISVLEDKKGYRTEYKENESVD